MEKNPRIEDLLSRGVEGDVYPGAVLLAARGHEVVFFQNVGMTSLTPDGKPVTRRTIFDLASLTKPLATTLALMKLTDEGALGLDQPLGGLLPKEGVPEDKSRITPRELMSHSAGLVDWEPYYLELTDVRREARKEWLREKRLLESPLVYASSSGTLYSDIGFMVLEWVIECRTGSSMEAFLDEHFYAPLSLERTFLSRDYVLPEMMGEEFAATEICPWRGETILGYVHDENAFALGGYSGHAGLFGTAEDVFKISGLLMAHFHGERKDYLKPETVREFFRRQELVEGSTWALGWDTPSAEGSSSGSFFSKKSVGHLGFTGASLWMDLERNLIVVFLTNRIHPTRANNKIRAFRPMVHDAVFEELGKGRYL